LNQRYVDKRARLPKLLPNAASNKVMYGSTIKKSFNWSKTEFKVMIGQNAAGDSKYTLSLKTERVPT
jgi:hypothetical protein